MEAYETEEQQVEALKKWWQENGKAIIAGAVIGLGGLFGWRAFQAHQLEQRELASDAYQAAQVQLNSGNLTAVENFIGEFGTSEYAALAALQLAKAQVDADDLSGAMEQLQWVADNSKDDVLVTLANVRLARLLIATEQLDAAEKSLATISAASWQSKVLALQGDIALQRGDHDAARTAYTESIALENDPVIKMKLDDLAQ
ncbi:YfgM family protein [Thaumasiovibrio sp. DFM-14]|uniref:YfgM family protein n=1 Tax=Thaumasiovibrio sp. DFM-14 TaxID=3384792 RepID=UPI0039A231A9